MKKTLPWWYALVVFVIVVGALLAFGTHPLVLVAFLIQWALFALLLFMSSKWFFHDNKERRNWSLRTYTGCVLAAVPTLLVLTALPLVYLSVVSGLFGAILTLIIWVVVLTAVFSYFFVLKKWYKSPTIALGVVIIFVLIQELINSLLFTLSI